MKKISKLIVVLIAVLVAPITVLASSPLIPSIPLLVCGDVTIDGSLAPVETKIIAEINNIEVSTEIKKEGRYCIGVPDGKDHEGGMITFKVNGIANSTQLQCVNINTTSRINFNLAVTTVSPPPPSGGSSTPPAPPKDTSPKLPKETPKEGEVKGATTTNILDGDIIQCKSCSDPFAVYIVKIVGNTKYIRHIVSLEIFNHYGHLKWENLKQADSLNNYSLSGWVRVNTGTNGNAGPTDKVYEINGDQTKHWINMTAEQFLSHGGSENAIYSINQGELDLYAAGPDVMSL